MAKVRRVCSVTDVSFDDIHEWFDENMGMEKLDLNDIETFKVYEKGEWGGVFQCVEENTQVLLASGESRSIKDVTVGDEIRSFNENKWEFVNCLVLRVIDQGIRHCVKLTIDNDRWLECTDDHKILTTKGWLSATDVAKEYCEVTSLHDVGDKHVYDLEVKNHHNFVANGIVVHNCTGPGAQKFFMRAKPKSIIDIAACTSIFRPGPLFAHVDKMWVKAKNDGFEYDWGDKRVNELLKETCGLIVFQEQIMFLAEKVGGFPKDKCDEVRRAIMKRSITGGEAAKTKVDELRSEFVDGAVKNGYDKEVADQLYDKIKAFSGYAFNLSHATAYAIDSYYCAWLMAHHRDEWLTAYLESMSGNDNSRSQAFGEVRRLGYKIVPIDVNYATKEWTVVSGKRLMPSMTTCKGVGLSALLEIESLRPISSLEEMLWDEEGNWRLSKFNRRSLEAMVNIQAFDSLDVVGEDKLFKNYHQMHEVLIVHNDEIKKRTTKDPERGRRRFYELIGETQGIVPWTTKERIAKMIEHFGSVDVSMLVPDAVSDAFAERGVRSVEFFDKKGIYWACVTKATPKNTKNGRKYMMLELCGHSGESQRAFMWSWDGVKKYDPYTVVLAELSKNDYGLTTSQKAVHVIDV